MRRSKVTVSNENILRKSMKRRSTLNGYIKFYEDLWTKGKILPNGGAYKRLVQLKERYVSTY
jgi:hypothetical protein